MECQIGPDLDACGHRVRGNQLTETLERAKAQIHKGPHVVIEKRKAAGECVCLQSSSNML